MSSHDPGATSATKSKKGKERRSSASFLTAILSFYSLPRRLILSPNEVILFEKQWNKCNRKQCKKSYSYRKFARRHKVFSTLRLFLNVSLLMTFRNMFLIGPQRLFHTANQILQPCPAVTVQWERETGSNVNRLLTPSSWDLGLMHEWKMPQVTHLQGCTGAAAKRKGKERNS